MTTSTSQTPIPPHFKAETVSEVYRVNYQQIATEANEWGKKHKITPASQDKNRVCLLLIDVQNTFCLPGFELFVGGQSGKGAIEDNMRICEFIYRNLGSITAGYPYSNANFPSYLLDK